MYKIDTAIKEVEKRISDNIKLMEEYIIEEYKLAEEKMENKFIESINLLKTLENKITDTNKWIVGTCVATIIVVVLIVAYMI